MARDLVSPTPTLHLGQSGGMDYSTPPHLLDQQKWRMLRNIRQGWSLEQVPRLLELVTVGSYPVQGVAAAPNQSANRGLWLAWDDYNLYQVSSSAATVLDTNTGEPWSRMSIARHNDYLFYCSNSQPKFTDGAVAWNLWDQRKCFTKHNGALSIGDGAFAPEPFYTLVGGAYVFDDDLGHSFTWTTGTKYRVYATNARLFPKGSSVKVVRSWYEGAASVTKTLTGLVLETELDYIVVNATNTVASVPNYGTQTEPTVSADPPWLITSTDMPSVPAGRYCTVFFDHVVVAGLVGNRNVVAWSDVNNYAEFIPDSDNEADTFVCTEHQRIDDLATGITGIQHLGDSLLVFTPSCVYEMTYTGLPRVMHVRPLIKDVGNGLPYATAGLADSVVWFDIHHGSFFMYSQSSGLQNVGAAVSEYFVDTLTTSTANARLTFSFVDREASEVGWWFIGAGDTYNAVVYNYTNKTWSVRTAPVYVNSHGVVPERAKTVSELTAAVSTYTGHVEDLDETGEGGHILHGGTTSLYKATFTGSPLTHDAILVETGDMLFGTLEGMKEVSRIILAVAGTHSGVKVEVSARDRISDTVTYVNCGTWNTTLPEKALTFPVQAGRVLRYRFTPQGDVKSFVFHGYEDNVVQTRARR